MFLYLLKIQKKIRLGFVSYDFRDHVIMYQIFDVIKELYKNSEFIDTHRSSYKNNMYKML